MKVTSELMMAYLFFNSYVYFGRELLQCMFYVLGTGQNLLGTWAGFREKVLAPSCDGPSPGAP